MRKFILYCFCFAAELCAARVKLNNEITDGVESGGFSYCDIARSAHNAADSALLHWKQWSDLG